MAIKGIGPAIDVTFDITAEARTTTSQYKVMGMTPGTSTAQGWTADATRTSTNAGFTASAFHALGILQGYESGTSESGTIRLFGISKAIAAESIGAGSWVACYHGASTAAMWGKLISLDDGVSNTAATTSITTHYTVLGRALESGSTNGVISIFLNPQMYDFGLVGTIGIT